MDVQVHETLIDGGVEWKSYGIITSRVRSASNHPLTTLSSQAFFYPTHHVPKQERFYRTSD